jgi:dTDP-4-dehydrorhamnose 3,5-epimerase
MTIGTRRPAITIVTATYNRSRALACAIESARRESFADWEMIVVGDACTDDTAEIVARAADPRIRFINLDRNWGEQAGPNNIGVAEARAPLIERGCLYEIFRESWPHSFHAVQWNACVSRSGVVRGVHAHINYDEFYTLPQGRVILGLHDIRRSSTSFGQTVQFEWLHQDACAIVIPKGVAHVVYFCEDSVLAFGLSNPWRAEYDVVGCKWDDPELGFNLPLKPIRSARANPPDFLTIS